MKEIEKEITTKQVIYEITKEELEKIKTNERNNGRYDIIEYLKFAISNYHLKMNLGGATQLVSDICDFIMDRTNNIQNTSNRSFDEFIRRYRK